MTRKKSNPFDLLILYLKRDFSNSNIAESRDFMGGFEEVNDSDYNDVFRVKSIGDIEGPDSLYEIQWGVYESGVINLLNLSNRCLSLYLSTIYLYGDRVRPMSGDCDLTNLLIFVKQVSEIKDPRLVMLAVDYLAYLNAETKSNLASNYCYQFSQLLILSLLAVAEKKDGIKLLEVLEAYDIAVDDIVDVTFEDVDWIEKMIVSISSCFSDNSLWALYEKRVVESANKNFGTRLKWNKGSSFELKSQGVRDVDF